MHETHIFIIWEKKHIANIINIIKKSFKILQFKTFNSNEYHRIIKLRGGKADNRGKKGFTALTVLDKSPKYETIHREYIKTLPMVTVNTNIYSLKIKLRKKYGGYHTLHSTNTLSEAKDTLKILGMEKLNGNK